VKYGEFRNNSNDLEATAKKKKTLEIANSSEHSSLIVAPLHFCIIALLHDTTLL